LYSPVRPSSDAKITAGIIEGIEAFMSRIGGRWPWGSPRTSWVWRASSPTRCRFWKKNGWS